MVNILCPICNKSLRQFSPAHLRLHNISTKEFVDKFPELKSHFFTVRPACPKEIYDKIVIRRS